MTNEEKNSYVKKQITSALIELLKEKELHDISISEIAAAAEVSRISFYRNYQTKEDILRGYINNIFKEWTVIYSEDKAFTFGEQISAMFAHLNNYREFYSLLNDRGLIYLLNETVNDFFTLNQEHSNIEAYGLAFMSYGVFGMIKEWISRGMQESAEDMAVLLKNAGK